MNTWNHYANLKSHFPLLAGYVPLQMERNQYSSITNRAEHHGISSATGKIYFAPTKKRNTNKVEKLNA